MRTLILGGAGLIGSHVAQHLSDLDHDVAAPGRQDVDILEISTLESALAGNIRGDATAFDVVINCAAHTDTDRAEFEPNLAYMLNAEAAGNVARCCYRRQVRLIHMSTELVLGSSPDPQDESAPIRPQGVYARTKAEGEEAVINETAGKAVVLRTQSVYGHGGRNWSSQIAGRLMDGEDVRADQGRRVTQNSAIEVSRRVALVVGDLEVQGIFHASAPEPDWNTWYWWAQGLARALDVNPANVRPIEHAYKVQRPDVTLACGKARGHGMAPMLSVSAALSEYADLCLEVGP